MSKGTILVVDDESEIREGLELLLGSEGYGVTSAGTGAEGLARLEEKPFDLLLLDVSLPDRNGLDMLREIRGRDSELSIVLITAYGPWIWRARRSRVARSTTSPSRGRMTKSSEAGSAGRGRPPPARRKRSTEKGAKTAL